MSDNTGFECDRCGYITQTEDDHAVTEDGQYLCLKCVEIVKNAVSPTPEDKKMIYAMAQGLDARLLVKSVEDYLKQGYKPWGSLIHNGKCYTQAVIKEID